MATNIPLPSKASLVQQYVGKSLNDIPLPAAILDIALIKKNCKRMLDTVGELGWELRVGVSGHKTTEITRLQIGEDPEDIRILVTTISDAENLLPLLLEYQQKGLQVLYNVPVPKSQVERIANISRILGKRGGTIRLLVDHEAQIPLLLRISELAGYPPYVYIAVDAGDHHMGVQPGSPELQSIFQQIEQLVLREGPVTVAFVGFYCDSSLGRFDVRRNVAIAAFEAEVRALVQSSMVEGIRLSVSETPVLSYLPQLLERNMAVGLEDGSDSLKVVLTAAKNRSHRFEVRASRYGLLDLKQLGTYGVMADADDPPPYAGTDMPLSILTEVTSVYPGRGTNGTTEALIAAGTSCLGSDSHPNLGWGGNGQGWYVKQADKESSVLAEMENRIPTVIECAQRWRVLPYNATTASQEFGWYFVVDSSRIDHGDEIVDIFVRWRG